jgi:hypothetical protein
MPEHSLLWHPGLAQAFDNAFAPGQIDRVVAPVVGAETTYGEGRIERQPRHRSRAGLI